MGAALHSRPLRAELALTYAGIAALTALLLGGILLGVLGGYYDRAEQSYLQSAARRILKNPETGSTITDAQEWVLESAVAAQARVKLYDASGVLVADSGPVTSLDLTALTRGRGERGEHRDERLPQPLGEGIFSGADTASTSDASLRIALANESGYFELSEPPVSGRAVLIGIAQAWIVAALLSVGLAALAGYLLSRRISRPLAALTEASDRMADGDLSARAPAVAGDEFGRLAASFNTMAQRNETTVVSLRRFVADAAHEIGTPLTALEADLELAEKAAITDDERRLVARALGQARRIESLSQGLLRLSRIEAGDAGATERVDVAALVREAIDTIASRAEQAGLALAVGEIAEPLVTLADHAKLQVVFENLLDNAVKFTPAGGSIAVSAVREGDEAVISIADTGVGIPLAEQDVVFSRFHRARNAASYPGSGLGLAIVSATVERAGGTVGFESSEAGTRFEVRLPLAGA